MRGSVARRARIARLVLLALAMLTAAAACGLPARPASGPAGAGPANDVWVVRHSWHTRLALRRADVDTSVWPESRDLGDVTYLEVGWGDRDFYSKPDPSVWDAIDPVVRATAAVLHVIGFDTPPGALLSDAAVVRLRVPAAGFERLTRFIHDAYALDAAGNPVRLRRGHYERSWFYLAQGRYHAIFSNSNRWVASALGAAGLPMEPSAAMTAGEVMAQAAAIAAPRAPRDAER